MARSFNSASGDKITLTASTTYLPSRVSFNSWVNQTGTNSGLRGVLTFRANTGAFYNYILGVQNGTSTTYFTNVSNVSGAALSAGVWYQLGGYIDTVGGGVAVVTNGSIVTTSGAVAFNTTASLQFVIGDEPSNAFFDGLIADVAIWNVILTQAEWTALSKGARPNNIRQSALIGYWPITGLQSPEPDLNTTFTLANNGTLSGTTPSFGPPIMAFTPRWPQFAPFTTPAPLIIPPTGFTWVEW